MKNALEIITAEELNNKIYTIRGQQVMLDCDLADCYQIDTKYLNRAQKRNIDRFPQDFCFQLTEEEIECLRCQIGTSNITDKATTISNTKMRGGRRYAPYAYTEQGISMLSAVLHTDIAILVSINIIRAFVKMRHILTYNNLILNRLNDLEIKQLTLQKDCEQKFNNIFNTLAERTEPTQTLFFDGQIYDAFSFITNLVTKAKQHIILIDSYVDIKTLNILAKKQTGVNIDVYTKAKSALAATDIANFNSQYPTLTVHPNETFHDRFLILDDRNCYHIGASLKDAGKKCFAISQLQDPIHIQNIIAQL